jgi:hypothetical protein
LGEERGEPIVRKFALVAVAMLGSCSTPENEALYLSCAGTSVDLVTNRRDPTTFLVKVGPEHGQGASLLFYSDREKRFEPSACRRNFTSCALLVESDEITEIGTMDGTDNRMLLSKRTNINRRTGGYRETLWAPGEGDRVTLFGQCTRGEPPPETQVQF